MSHSLDRAGVVTSGPRILVVDNYDSFAYNLVQYVGQFAGHVHVRRNDAIDIDGIRSLDPDGIVVSPGPGTPAAAGVSMPIFEDLDRPAFGVCLGHQALCAANGAPVTHAPRVVHGKASMVRHDGQGIFATLDRELAVGRYHSLGVEREGLPTCLKETAHTVPPGEVDEHRAVEADPAESGLVMAVRHTDRPHIGVQFHPESVLTDDGLAMIQRFVEEIV